MKTIIGILVNTVKLYALPDVIFVSHFCLLNNKLSVKQHKATHDGQTQIHVSLKQIKTLLLKLSHNCNTCFLSGGHIIYLKDHLWGKEHVEEGDDQKNSQARHQSAYEKKK